MILRDYQQAAVDGSLAALSNGKVSTLGVLPTGMGKTVIFANVANRWPTGRVMVIAHREELIFQAADKIHAICGDKPEIEMAEFRATRHGLLSASNVVVSSVQTLNSGRKCDRCGRDDADECPFDANDGFGTDDNFGAPCSECLGGIIRRMQRFDPMEFGLLVIDEAHHATAATYRRVIDYFRRNPALRVLGVTATPDRADEEALGKVFDSVSFEMGILDGINGGWLVPIEQQWVVVDGLDLSSCRTTAGDINEGDLEQVMLEEKNLHGVVSPTMEIAGERPTLMFTASVAHAELATDIINRHKPGSALCITGSTPKEIRRDELKAYSQGKYQYLVGCGVFLEGFDEPRIDLVAMARPTKSRSLYAQAIGRGTRPIVPPCDATAEERRAAIAGSRKPGLLVLDFVGNSGRHKLVCTADILGGNFDDATVERAVKNAKSKGGPRDMLEEFDLARQELEEQKRRERVRLVAKAQFTKRSIDPFDIFAISAPREPGWHKGRKPTPKQLEILTKSGIDTKELSFCQASKLLDTIFKRRRDGLATFKQIKTLARFGDAADNWTFERASGRIDAIAKNGWKPIPSEPAPF